MASSNASYCTGEGKATMQPALPFIVAILITASAFASDDDRAKLTEAAEAAANVKREQIRAEIKQLGKHECAGEYRGGAGLGDSRLLLLAPSSGYLYENNGCVGVIDRNYGTVVLKDDRLRLSFKFDNTQRGPFGIASEMALVKWGEHRYLIPADEFIGFCNRVNQGLPPQGAYLVRLGDGEKNPVGPPELPPPYREYLLSKPIEASIVAVQPSTLRPSIVDWKFKDTRLTIDAGGKQGLKVGMELVVTKPDLCFETLRITSVEDSRAEGIMTQIGEEAAGPKVGWRISTRSPWSKVP